MTCITVLWCFQRVGQRVHLGLQTDLDDFHGIHNQDCLGDACTKASWEGGREWASYPRAAPLEKRTQEDISDGGFPCFAICKPAFVRLETRKPYCHLWHYTGEYGAKTLVQCKRCLAAHNHGTSRDKAARFGLNTKVERHESRTIVERHVPPVCARIWRAACVL